MWRLLWREIWHRRLNFFLGLVGVFFATSLVVGGMTLLDAQQVLTQALLDEKRAVVTERNRQLTDAMRRITKNMGFNVVIMPKGQNLDDPFANDYAGKFMPEEYADRLANSEIVTVNHLLPTLEQRVQWPERENRVLFLVGVKGQVPIAHRDPRKPIMQPVPKEGIVLGDFLARSEGLAKGDRVTLRGQEFQVVKVNPRRGDKRDRTAWIDLDRMQAMFDKEGKINAIWALECSCALADVGKVRAELTRILPDVHIEEQGEKALARAEARKKAVDAAEKNLEAELVSRERLTNAGEQFRLFFVPGIIVIAGVWLALLAFGNVRARQEEIGLLNALGLRARSIATLFLSRAVLSGVLGALVGCLVGFALGGFAFDHLQGDAATTAQGGGFDSEVFLWVLVLAPLLSAIACWLPALRATQQDPAVVLRAE